MDLWLTLKGYKRTQQSLPTQGRTLPHTFDEEESAWPKTADEVRVGGVGAADLDVGGDLVPGHVAVRGKP